MVSRLVSGIIIAHFYTDFALCHLKIVTGIYLLKILTSGKMTYPRLKYGSYAVKAEIKYDTFQLHSSWRNGIGGCLSTVKSRDSLRFATANGTEKKSVVSQNCLCVCIPMMKPKL